MTQSLVVAAAGTTAAGSCLAPRETLARWFTEYHDVVCRAVRRRGEDADSAADFAQQAFLVATERFLDIREGSERAFLIATATQLSYTSRRKHGRMQLAADLEPYVADAPDDEARLVRYHYASQLVDRALSQLDETLRSIFLLYEADGVSRVEIARELGIPLGTVASRLRRARELYYAKVAELDAVDGNSPRRDDSSASTGAADLQ